MRSLKNPPIKAPRDVVGRLDEPLAELLHYLCLNGVFIPRLLLAFLPTAHSDDDVGEVLHFPQVSVEAWPAAHGIG